MPAQTVDHILERVEQRLREQFPSDGAGPRLEFARQYFSGHVELWVYTFALKDFEPVKAFCDQQAQANQLDQMDPEIWLLVKTWTGHWPGGESEHEIRNRREAFRRRHQLPTRSA